MHDCKKGHVSTAVNKVETAPAGNLLNGFLFQMAELPLGSLNNSEGDGCARTFRIWT